MRVSYIAYADFTQASIYGSLEKEKVNKREKAGPR